MLHQRGLSHTPRALNQQCAFPCRFRLPLQHSLVGLTLKYLFRHTNNFYGGKDSDYFSITRTKSAFRIFFERTFTAARKIYFHKITAGRKLYMYQCTSSQKWNKESLRLFTAGIFDFLSALR